MNRKQARFVKRQRAALYGLGIVLLALLVTLLVRNNLYVLRTIEIEGNSYFTDNEIIRKAKITPGSSIFALKEEDLTRAFGEEGAVQLLSAQIRMPDTLKLTVRESTPHAVASFAGRLVVLDEEGYVIKTETSASNYAVPSVTGLEMQLCNVGKRIECATAGMLESYCEVIKAIYALSLQETVSEISLHNLDSITMATRQGILIKAGDRSSMTDKLRIMKVCLQDVLKEGRKSGVIDVSTPKGAYYSPN